MAITDDTAELTPGPVFRDGDETTLYWLKGGAVMYRHFPVRGADAESFRFYRGNFGKDRAHCYCTARKLPGGDPVAFRALNRSYFTDGRRVWTLGGPVEGADAAAFEVCDDGVYLFDPTTRMPHGFGKDRERVFYTEFDRKPVWVKKADPSSFVSLNDGFYGTDADHVFCKAVPLPKANVARWRRVGGYYSADDRRVYYIHREIRGADVGSFAVVPTRHGVLQLARDAHRFYTNDEVIGAADFQELFEKHGVSA